MEIEYRVGDVLDHVSAESRPVVIAHVVNNKGVAGAGFALALKKRYPMAIQCYHNWHNYDNPAATIRFTMGNIQVVSQCVNPPIWVCNMLCQDGYGREAGHCYLDYVALDECLRKLATWCIEHGAEIACPRIGCGLAGAKWENVAPLVWNALCKAGVLVFVYTLEGGEGE